MAEYIERQAIEKYILDGLNNPDKNKKFGFDAVEILTEVHYMPAADVAPVRHGAWTVITNDLDDDVIYECPICGAEIKVVDNTPAPDFWNYCPKCATKMDLEDRNDR